MRMHVPSSSVRPAPWLYILRRLWATAPDATGWQSSCVWRSSGPDLALALCLCCSMCMLAVGRGWVGAVRLTLVETVFLCAVLFTGLLVVNGDGAFIHASYPGVGGCALLRVLGWRAVSMGLCKHPFCMSAYIYPSE